MKYRVYTRFDGVSFDDTIEGSLTCCDNYYHFKDKDGKSCYYPIMFTVIQEL
jgi:hypothetical protein